jgi:hypothetical protein
MKKSMTIGVFFKLFTGTSCSQGKSFVLVFKNVLNYQMHGTHEICIGLNS